MSGTVAALKKWMFLVMESTTINVVEEKRGEELAAVDSHGRTVQDLPPHDAPKSQTEDEVSEQVSVVLRQRHQSRERISLTAQENLQSV